MNTPYQVTAIPLTNIRHAVLDPVSSKPLKTRSPDQQKTLTGMTGLFLIFPSIRLLYIHPDVINKAC
jgi:hypothetical protein